MVYTVPFELNFSKDRGELTNRYDRCHVLPMIPVCHRDGNENQDSMALLRETLMIRAFPDADQNQRADRITEVFDTPETLDRLCRVSGGHVRYLLTLFGRCIEKENALPISGASLDYVIRELRNEWSDAIPGHEWELLQAVGRTKEIDDYEKYHRLLRNVFVVQYREPEGTWFDVNPVLKGAKKLEV